jgi:hypothetical protein
MMSCHPYCDPGYNENRFAFARQMTAGHDAPSSIDWGAIWSGIKKLWNFCTGSWGGGATCLAGAGLAATGVGAPEVAAAAFAGSAVASGVSFAKTHDKADLLGVLPGLGALRGARALLRGGEELLQVERGATRAEEALQGLRGARRVPRVVETAPHVERDTALRLYDTWPSNRGFLGGPFKQTLKAGTIVDRYGFDTGRFTSPAGTPFERRALPVDYRSLPLRTYEVQQPLEVAAGATAPAFGMPGLGIQYELPDSVRNLLSGGYLREVND